MATIIQLRRGSYTNFDPQKMKPGELAVVQSNDPVGDGKALYFCVSAGVVKRLSSYEDIVSAVQDATNEVAEMFIEQVSDDVERAEAAAESVEQEAQQIDTNTQDIADLKSDLTEHIALTYESGYIDCSSEPVDITTRKTSQSYDWHSVVTTCTAGDIFIVNALGGQAPKAYAFLDSSKMILESASTNANISDLTVTAPANSAYFIINDRDGRTSYSVDGDFITERVDALETGKIDKQQPTADAGKALIVGDDGIVVPTEITDGLSDEAKEALLACFEHVAWTDEYGQSYYDALESALYADTYPKITATFDSGLNVIYTDDTLDSLKQYLTVKYYETAESTGTTVPSADYTLRGTLTEGASTIIVSYDSVLTTFTISNVVDFYNIWRWEWSASGGNLVKLHGSAEPGQTDLTMYPSGAALNTPYEVRRTYCVERGKAPYYRYLATAVPTQYYPIPIPGSANYVKITTLPAGQFIYLTFYEFNGVKYDPRLGRTMWTELSNGSFERALALGSGNQRFLVFNMKYDSAGESYPVEPTSMVIEFSEVE